MRTERESPVPAELVAATFGPLDKYVAANDNRPVANDNNQGGQYIGLTRSQQQQHHRNFIESTEAWRASTDRVASGLAALRLLDGYIYLGSPYTLYPKGHDAAARDASECAAILMARGLPIYAPIPHGHSITLAGDLPKDWDFWKRQCDPMIDAAAALIVLTMDGWQESVGLTYEIATFLVAQKPILYLSPEELSVGWHEGERRMAA